MDKIIYFECVASVCDCHKFFYTKEELFNREEFYARSCLDDSLERFTHKHSLKVIKSEFFEILYGKKSIHKGFPSSADRKMTIISTPSGNDYFRDIINEYKKS